jgi:flagellar protein FlaG
MDIAKTALGVSNDQYFDGVGSSKVRNQEIPNIQKPSGVKDSQNESASSKGKLQTRDLDSVKKYSKIAEDILGAFNVELKFKVLKDPKGVVEVEVWNKTENKLIRKIPPDDVIHLIKHIQDMMGKLLDKKA